MVVVPIAPPLTIPVSEPTVAISVLALLQTPPAVALLNVVVLVAQTCTADGTMATGVTLQLWF